MSDDTNDFSTRIRTSWIAVYTVAELALELKYSTDKILDLIRAGSLKATKIGNSYRIRLEAVEDMLKNDQVKTARPEDFTKDVRVRLMNMNRGRTKK